MSIVNSSSSQAAVTNEINNLARELKNKETVQVFKDDTGTRRVLFGKGPNGFYGGKVSQEGVDVWDATDDQLVFNSDNNLFKIVGTGTLDLPQVTPTLYTTNTYSGSAESSATHNLGYVPSVIGFMVGSDGSHYSTVPYVIHVPGGTGGGIGIATFDLGTTSTTVKATVRVTEYGPYYGSAGGAPITDARTIRYYLIRETAS